MGQEEQIGPWPVSPAILSASSQVTPGQNEGVSAASDVIAQGSRICMVNRARKLGHVMRRKDRTRSQAKQEQNEV